MAQIAYEVKNNEQYNSKEIKFDGIPAVEVREALKGLRFRWHSVKKIWYGFADEETIRAAIDGKKTGGKCEDKPSAVPPVENEFGVKVGDLFVASWGYDQTNNDYFQVIALCGKSSVRVREVHPEIVSSSPVSPMSEDRVVAVPKEILPPADHSIFIKDQTRGDLKRLKSYTKNPKDCPQFAVASFANAYKVNGSTIKVYESWYA